MSKFNQPELPIINHLRSISRRFLFAPMQRAFGSLSAALAAVKAPTRQAITHAAPAIRSYRQPCKPITVISANLWHDWPRHRQLQTRLDAFANLAESQAADIVLLQEVARMDRLKADEWLAERLGMGYAYARANGHHTGIGFEEGLAVFSRYPLELPKMQQLGESSLQMSRRMALGTRVNTPCGDLMVFSVHLGISNWENRAQLNRLRNWIGGLAGEQTALIGGDFNAHESRSHIRGLQGAWLDTFRHKNPHRDGTTHELRWPWGEPMRRRRLDYLFLQNGGVHWDVLDADHVSAKVGSGIHSDHQAVLARLMPVIQS
jgi:endonuclease/exonuclease/phosphatase family metal-dependent hydrolase